jgi:PAS domain S-box-containing protein
MRKPEPEEAGHPCRSFLETMNGGAVTLTADGTVAYCNRHFSDLIGTPLELVMGASLEGFVAPHHRHRLRPLLAQALSGNAQGEVPFLAGDGTEVWAALSLSPMKLKDATGICLVVADITERKRADELRIYLAAIVDSSDDAIVGINLDNVILSFNPAAERLSGYSAAEIVGQPVSLLWPPDRTDGPLSFVDRIARGETILNYETERLGKGGRRVQLSVSMFPVRDSEGHITGGAAVARDITRRKQADEALRLSEAELKEAQRVAHLGSWSMDVKTGQVAWSDELYRMMGFDPSLPPPPYPEHGRIFTPESFARLAAGLDNTVRTGVPYELELETVRADGDHGWMLARGEPVRDASGAITGLRGIAQDIAERKQAEAARQESETAFRTLADSVPQMVWMCTPDGLNVYFNQRWVDYTGLSLADSYGRGWNTPFHPDDRQPAWDAWNHATETGETYRVESRLRAADGSYRWFLMRGVPLRDAAGHIVKWFGTCTDIDDLKQGEEALRNLNEELEKRVEERTAQLRDSEQRLALALRASHEGVWDWNVETGAVWYSSRCREMLGYAESEIEPHMSVLENLLHPDDRASFREAVEAVLRGEREHEMEFRLRHKDGHYVDILSCGFPVRRQVEGPIVRIVGTHFDLTERKRAEEALRQREEWLRLAHAAAHSGAWEWDLRTNLNIWSEELWKLYGLEPHSCEPSYAAWLEVVHPDDRPTAERTVEEAARKGIDLIVEFRVRDRDGTERWLLSRGRPFQDADGQVVRVVGIVVDITERKRSEEALQRSHDELERRVEERTAELSAASAYHRSLIEASLDPLVTIAPEGTITDVNHATEQVTGRPRQELIGTDFCDYFTDREKARRGYQQAFREGSVQDYELQIRHRDGHITPVRYNASVYRHEGGAIAGVFAAARDITGRKRAEQEVLRLNQDLERRVAERTAQLERAAAELEKRNLEVERVNRMKTDFLGRSSHELRTPLNAILGYSDLLGEQSAGPLPPPYPRFVANIQEGARHLLEIVNDLLDISKIEAGRIDLNREAFRFADALEEVLSVIAPLAKIKHIAIDIQVPAGMSIRADRTRFKQVLYNLLSNAVKFTPENGRVWIADSSREDAAAFCVGDTGIGIPASELKSIFDEFHQVNDPSRTAREGTGLGLSITRRLVDLHGGSIAVESVLGQGSRFTVSLGPLSLV